MTHGTLSSYFDGCKCVECRKAHERLLEVETSAHSKTIEGIARVLVESTCCAECATEPRNVNAWLTPARAVHKFLFS